MDLIINFTPTGMIPTKNITPHVPVTTQEIIDDVLMAADIGITMVHLHAREEQNGNSTYKSEIYGRIIEGIRRFCNELVICVSLSGRTYNQFKKRADVLKLKGQLKPDMGSLTLSSVNFNHVASVNSPEIIKALATEMKHNGILPELEAFDSGMINYAKYLERLGLLEAPHYFNLILGNIACAQADFLHVGLMVNDLPPNSVWSLGGIGNYQLRVNSMGIAMGGGVRVGIEDNIWYDQARTRLANNSDLIRRIHKLAEHNERKIMSPVELRKLLQLEDGHGSYGRTYANERKSHSPQIQK